MSPETQALTPSANRPVKGHILQVLPEMTATSIGGWVYVPGTLNKDANPLVALHGISRNGREQVELLAPRAEALGRIVIAPHFPAEHWKVFQRITNLHRPDLALLDFLGRVRDNGLADTRHFDLAGYSGGAQLAHRFAMLFPHKIRKLSLSAAGWYSMPDGSIDYPYGLASKPGGKVDWGPQMFRSLPDYLRLTISIFVGEHDDQQDAALRRNDLLERTQGATRLERAERYHNALTEAARAHDIAPKVTLTRLPGCAHSFPDCVETGGLDRLLLN